MKVRYSHVTNSSSSSFIIAKKYLDEDQIKAIRNHVELWRKLGNEITKWDFPWDIEENKEFIAGYTDMDNFDMWNFLEEIDVNSKLISWGTYPFDLKDDYEDLKSYDKTTEWRELIHEM